MTPAPAAPGFADAARRFARSIADSADGWSDQVGDRVRAERCRPLEAEAARFGAELQAAAEEIAAARRRLG